MRIVHTYLLREYSANLWKMDKDIQKELETGDTLKKLMQENPETQQQRGELISMIAQLEDCKRQVQKQNLPSQNHKQNNQPPVVSEVTSDM